MAPSADLPPARERFLRYWSANMTGTWDATGTDWYGFSYTDAEKTRMREIAAGLPGSAYGLFIAVLVLGFLVIAAVAVAGIMIPFLMWLYPDPSKTSTPVFVSTLAAACFLCLSFGLPLAMGWGARAGDRWGGGAPGWQALGDAELYAKVRFQLRRMAMIMVGIFVPGCLLFILFDIDAGPLVFWLKLLCGATAVASLAGTLRAGKS